MRTLDSFLLKIHKQIKNKASSDLKKNLRTQVNTMQMWESSRF